ncbi:hypothetical protein FHX57_002119 [Paraburkholderia tropica]|uniref:hypothetical protein n=1 Tax=Paraburkholderia tropica TaxID=92647 RepID=UPI0016133412|nr:hypothetical protein [Paraburkholderia tropica]MBB2999788.1 hypothetical protein [Paraburkholderia tropica]
MTSAALARLLSEMRDDGKETGPGTVSRWLNGVSATDPGVMGWLRELLRNKVRNQGVARIDWGLTESVLLIVGNAKGGVGSSCLAAGLALIATESFNQPVRHIRLGVHNHDESENFQKLLRSRKIASDIVSFEQLANCTPHEKEFVIVDLARATMTPEELARAASQLPYDLLLVPADFTSGDIHATKRFFQSLSKPDSVAFLHHTGWKVSIDFARFARSREFALWEKQFINFIFPRSTMPPVDWEGSGKWNSDDQEALYTELFVELLERVGLRYEQLRSCGPEIESLTLEQLLQAAGH